MAKLIIYAPDIFTNNDDAPFLKSSALVTENGVIIDIGDEIEIKKRYPDTPVENTGNGLLTPGLVNLHHHLYSSLARGWNPEGQPPGNFPQILKRIWWKLDKALTLDDIYYSAMVGLCDSVRLGVTTVIDHHAAQTNVTGSLDKIADAYRDTGVKGSLCFEITDREGQKIFEAGLNESISALEKYANDNTSNLKAMVGLHASMTLSDESLKQIYEATSKYEPGYHFHLAEDKSDQDDSLAKYGIRAAERFAHHNMLGPESLAIHGVHLNDEEIKILADSGTNLVMCPRSNQNNAVGVPRWWDYNGVHIGLGTDGIGSDIISEAKSALYISHHISGDPALGFGDICRMLLHDNYKICEKIIGIKTGKLAIGYPADIVLWNYDPPTPINKDNISGHYLYGLYNHNAQTVWINGEKIFDKGVFLKFDYHELMSACRKIAEKLWSRI